jgi:hypothetical protein
MEQERHNSDASVANTNNGVVSDAKNEQFGVANTKVATPNRETGATGQDVTAAIADKIMYSVTIEEAQERFARARRKVPSIRSLQRYCQDGLIKGLRTPVTYDDGSHAEPWFINDASLDAHIKQQPIVVLGDHSDAKDPLATPTRAVGDAKVTKSPGIGDAGVANVIAHEREVKPPASPDPQPAVIPVSEILLENARLQERLEGKTEIIQRIEVAHATQRQDWSSEREFLRTDVTETRALVRDFKSVSDRILDTFKQIGSKQSDAAEKVEPSQILYKPVQPGGESRPA